MTGHSGIEPGRQRSTIFNAVVLIWIAGVLTGVLVGMVIATVLLHA